MTAQSQLEKYLESFRNRLRRLVVARAAAALAIAALIITLVAVYFGMRRAFDPGFIIGARSVLLAALIGIAVAALIIPLRRLRAERAIADIEGRAPEFEGRLETFAGLREKPRRSPFLGLLAEDSLKLAAKVPVIGKVPSMQINAPFAVAALCAVMLLGVGSVGPDTWRYGVRHLWAGWLLDDTLPPQRIAVEPGDGAVRRGGDLTVSGQAEGFAPVSMTLYAQLREGAPWQSTLMDRGPENSFEFTFFAVREPVRYYVEAAGIRSPEFTVTVVDVPEITNITLSYVYPQWTRLDPATEDPGSDIRAVAGTEVEVQIETDRPLDTALLDVNGDAVPMRIAGNTSTASLTVSEEGEYHFATDFGDDVVRLSDDYFISVVEDQEPVIDVVKPGRDWRASNIEEVTVRIEANDDFGLDLVELHYSINGAEWQIVSVPADGRDINADEILYLEEMTPPIRASASMRSSAMPLTIDNLRELREEARAAEAADAAEAEDAAPPAPESLEAGDLISYFVVAEDREQRIQSDLFFIEVQPFDRRFSQASAGGGGGGGGGGQQQNEISARQKEILVATWNLIREQDEEQSFLDEQQLADNATMLAELQTTLAEQARTLAQRTRARQLTNADDRIERFVEALEMAAEAMDPAAERLNEVALDDAVPSEQAALQHLLRAESVFTDIQVAFQQGGGGGGGGLAGRDLSELFELEMDLEQNQYETEAPVAMDQQEQGEQEVDEAIAKLQELARRQENLARQAQRRQNLTEQERWQQEQLRRETEELRRELEELQQRMAQAQQQQGEQQGQQPGEQQQGQQSGQPGQPGQPGQGGQQNAQTGGQISESAMRDLNNALQAMNRAAQGGEQMDPEQARRAIEQARRELDQALEQMTAQRQMEATEAFTDIADRSESLYEEQRRLANELQQALESALDEQISNRDNRDGRGTLPREQALEFSDRKAEMWQELEALEEDIQRVAQEFRGRTPEASETLDDALADLQQMQGALRLQYGAQALRQGGEQQVAATDAVTTSALRNLERSTDSALERARVEAVEGESRELSANDQLVAEIQTLRRQLAEIAAGGENQGEQPGGQQGQNGEQPGQSPGQQPGGFGGQLGGNQFGGGRGYYDPNRVGAWGQFNPDNWRDPEDLERLREELNDTGREWLSVATRLRGEGVSEEELRAMRELGEAMRGNLPGNPELVAEEFRNLVNLAEQLELQLREGSDDGEFAIRAEVPNPFSPEYEEAVAEYYRRLSRSEN